MASVSEFTPPLTGLPALTTSGSSAHWLQTLPPGRPEDSSRPSAVCIDTRPATSMCLSIFTADDHPIFRRGLCEIIAEESDLQLVGQASAGDEALEQILALRPDAEKDAGKRCQANSRANIGMSASEWGKLIGIDRSTASRLLHGERPLNTAHIRNSAKALHLAPELLL